MATQLQQPPAPKTRAPALSVVPAGTRRQRKAALRQLSIYGCHVASSVDAVAGDALTLRCDRTTPVAATVVWCEGGVIGARFDQPLDRDQLRALSERLA